MEATFDVQNSLGLAQSQLHERHGFRKERVQADLCNPGVIININVYLHRSDQELVAVVDGEVVL